MQLAQKCYNSSLMSYIFGPVPSRRLGRSLGVDLVPNKVCTLNCIYCQVGPTTNQTLTRAEYTPVSEILKELKNYFDKELGPVPDVITFSGSGEPTLNSKIGELIARTKKLFPKIPVSVLTNGTMLWDPQIRHELKSADIVIPSLDAATEEVFLKVNRPHPKLKLKKMLEGLFAFKKLYKGELWVEVLLVKNFNDSTQELKAIKEFLDRLKPARTQLNTVVRPPQEPFALPLERGQMEKICAIFGSRCEVIAGFDRKELGSHIPDLKQAIVEIVKRRSVTADDISESLGVDVNEVKAAINELVNEKSIKKVSFHNKIFYQHWGG